MPQIKKVSFYSNLYYILFQCNRKYNNPMSNTVHVDAKLLATNNVFRMAVDVDVEMVHEYDTVCDIRIKLNPDLTRFIKACDDELRMVLQTSVYGVCRKELIPLDLDNINLEDGFINLDYQGIEEMLVDTIEDGQRK